MPGNQGTGYLIPGRNEVYFIDLIRDGKRSAFADLLPY